MVVKGTREWWLWYALFFLLAVGVIHLAPTWVFYALGGWTLGNLVYWCTEKAVAYS